MSNFKNVLKVFKMMREFEPDDHALLNTLRGATEPELELLVEAVGPQKKPTRKLASKGAGKSRRASGMAAQLNTRLAAQQRALTNGDCAFILNDTTGETCDAKPDDPIHDQTFGYGGYHEFQPATAQAAAGGE